MIREIDLLDIKEITKVVKEQYDIDFSKWAFTSLRIGLINACNTLNQESIAVLLNNVKNPIFFENLCSHLVVNVTEIFRDPSFWRKLKDELKQRYQNASKLKIWLAGCSTGEELLSLNILLKEIGLFDKAKIIATEVNDLVISKAKEFKCSAKNMETTNSNYERLEVKTPLTVYYKDVDGTAEFDKRLLDNVVFKPFLLASSAEFSDKFDFILCRNVLIYFNSLAQDQILNRFSECLYTGGMLAIGVQETVVGTRNGNLFTTVSSEEKIYSKR